jgi:uncharacterized protein DUF1329
MPFLQATQRNKGRHKIFLDGNLYTLEGKPWMGGNPFPQPQSAQEVLMANTLSWGKHDTLAHATLIGIPTPTATSSISRRPTMSNRYGAPLGPSGVRFKLAQYAAAAAKKAPSLASKTVTPHSFRHATAVHLVAAGVDLLAELR